MITTGWWNQAILNHDTVVLPVGFHNGRMWTTNPYSAARQDAAWQRELADGITHELAYIRHRDILIISIATALEKLHWGTQVLHSSLTVHKLATEMVLGMGQTPPNPRLARRLSERVARTVAAAISV